jgi:hypothetical protein
MHIKNPLVIYANDSYARGFEDYYQRATLTSEVEYTVSASELVFNAHNE